MRDSEVTEKKTVRLKPSNYQPSKAELEEALNTPDVPGDTLEEQMDAFADAVMQPAEVEHEES